MPLEKPAFDDGIACCLELRRVGRRTPEFETGSFELVERLRDAATEASSALLCAAAKVSVYPVIVAHRAHGSESSGVRSRTGSGTLVSVTAAESLERTAKPALDGVSTASTTSTVGDGRADHAATCIDLSIRRHPQVTFRPNRDICRAPAPPGALFLWDTRVDAWAVIARTPAEVAKLTALRHHRPLAKLTALRHHRPLRPVTLAAIPLVAQSALAVSVTTGGGARRRSALLVRDHVSRGAALIVAHMLRGKLGESRATE